MRFHIKNIFNLLLAPAGQHAKSTRATNGDARVAMSAARAYDDGTDATGAIDWNRAVEAFASICSDTTLILEALDRAKRSLAIQGYTSARQSQLSSSFLLYLVSAVKPSFCKACANSTI
jgi:hypothetical protein